MLIVGTDDVNFEGIELALMDGRFELMVGMFVGEFDGLCVGFLVGFLEGMLEKSSFETFHYHCFDLLHLSWLVLQITYP